MNQRVGGPLRLFAVLPLLSAMVVLLPAAASAAPTAVAGGTGAFTPHPTTPSFGAGNSYDVTLGDLDGDKDLDAVVANFSGDAETVWLNDGTGRFTWHPTMPSFGAGRSTAVALGDLDGDDDLDAVVANHSDVETVWRNDGTGRFRPHQGTPSFEAGSSIGVALGDLDGDDDLDAVFANGGGERETVWLNDGTGAFTPHPTTPNFGAGNSFAVTLGDLNGDGRLDAVVANYSFEPETVWLNDGTGTFTRHPTVPSFGGGFSEAVALGDLDGDKDLDAVVANCCKEPVTVWRNDGTGALTAHPTTPSFSANNNYDVALGDLDGDADLDAVVAIYGTGAETVWRNDGAGNFTPHPTTPSFGAGFSTAVALGDLDGDADLDALVANNEGEAETVWLNRDRAGVQVTPTTVSVAEGGAAAGYQLVLTGQPSAAVTIAVTTDGQLRAEPPTLTFTAANWRTPQTVSVSAVDDATEEGVQSATIEHRASSSDAFYDGLSIAAVAANIADNDSSVSVPTPPIPVPAPPILVPAPPTSGTLLPRVWVPLP